MVQISWFRVSDSITDQHTYLCAVYVHGCKLLSNYLYVSVYLTRDV